MKLNGTPAGRVLTDIRHGGHVVAPTEEVEERARDELGEAAAAAPVAREAAELAEWTNRSP